MTQNQPNTVFASNVVSLPPPSSRVVVFEPPHTWREAVIARLEMLIRLESGWDGYAAQPVSLENAMFALRMLEAACTSGAPAPQIVPGLSGDLQIEWHLATGDVELHVRAPNDVHAWRHVVGQADDGKFLELTNEFSAVAGWIRELTEPAGAVETAAA